MKHNKVFWITLALVNLTVLGILALLVSSNKDYSVNQKKNAYLIGASYMTMNNEFYKIVSEEISAKIEAEGDRLILRDPALDASRQIEQIKDMMDLNIDVLV